MDVLHYLAKKGAVIEREMVRAIPPRRRPWEVYGLIWDFLKRGGKRFRPELCLLSCEAVGGKRSQAMPAAVAIELFHNFSLIHDDIEDDSAMRRGKPCLHRIYGVPLAINAGDGLFVMVLKALQRLPEDKALHARAMLENAFIAVLEGQGMELNWYRNNRWDVGERDYLRMVAGKTGSLISASCEVGAFLGGGRPAEVRALKEFGMEIGIAFQIQDDVLNLIGTEAKYKKEIGGDITEGKRSIIVTKAMEVLPKEEKARLVALLSSGTRDRKSINEAIELLRGCGAIDYASAKSLALVRRAERRLAVLRPSPARERLKQIADFFVKREF
ncbi:MAG: polyprenyl synthetase family protein [Candidatus Micrarchaeia archaeon]